MTAKQLPSAKPRAVITIPGRPLGAEREAEAVRFAALLLTRMSDQDYMRENCRLLAGEYGMAGFQAIKRRGWQYADGVRQFFALARTLANE